LSLSENCKAISKKLHNGLFNRGITDENRKAIAKDLADYLGVTEGVPNSFEGIPILNNQKSWFFGFEDKRQTTDIESSDVKLRLTIKG
jgi:hypothetical protein